MSRIGRRAALGIVLVAVLGAGVGLGALLFGDDDGSQVDAAGGVTTTVADGGTAGSSTTSGADEPGADRPSSAPTIPVDGLSGDALEFVEALNRASGMTYHARYEGASQTEDGTTANVAVEVWRRLPLARRDFTIAGGGQRFASREYRTSSGILGCLDTTDDGTDDFQCTDTSVGAGHPGAAAFGAVDPHGGAVTAADDTVDGVAVRCYRVTPDAGLPKEVCFDGNGIPLVVDDGEIRLVRTELDDDVTDADLAPPSS